MTDKQGADMQGPAFKFEWNLNTIATLLGFGLMIFGAGQAWAAIEGKFNSVNQWIGAHEELHKERNATITGDTRATEERFRAVEARIAPLDNLSYRLTVNEASTAATAQALKEIQAAVNKQAVDQATTLAILNRIDQSLRTQGPQSPQLQH